MNKTFIYGLVDPRDRTVRYIGKSNDLKRRLKDHICSAKRLNNYKDRWIKQLIELGLKPVIVIIETIDELEWEIKEKYWIKYYRDLGARLTNETEGGDGVHNPSIEARQKLSKSKTGKFMPQETKDKISRALKGKVKSKEHLEKISKALQGHTVSKETLESMRIANTGRKMPPQTREAIHRANIGRIKSIEERQILSTKLKGQKRTPQQRENMSMGRKRAKLERQKGNCDKHDTNG